MKPPTIKSMMIAVIVAALACSALIVVPREFFHQYSNTQQKRCQYNLHQIGYGVAGYIGHQDRFPPGSVPNPDLPPEKRLGWGSTFLPYVDCVGYFEEHGTTWDEASRLAWDDPAFSRFAADTPGIMR